MAATEAPDVARGSGIFTRVERGGRWGPVDIFDLSESELNAYAFDITNKGDTDCARFIAGLVDGWKKSVRQPFTCGARKGNTGAGDPQDCNWPLCGCDPAANKVLEALDESGYAAPATVVARSASFYAKTAIKTMIEQTEPFIDKMSELLVFKEEGVVWIVQNAEGHLITGLIDRARIAIAAAKKLIGEPL